MQRQTLLVSAAVFALLACAAWFLSVRDTAPKARAALPVAPLSSSAPLPSPPAASATVVPTPAPASPTPAALPTPRPAIAATPPAPDAANDAGETPVDPAPEGAAADAAPDDGSGAPPDAATREDTAVASATPADAADTGATPGDGAAHDAPSPAPTPDPHDVRAADLFAQRIEALDDPHGDDAQDAHAAAAQQAYEARGEGGDATKTTQAIVHDLFANWLATLPRDGSHPSLISIDCREGACRVLIAQAGVDFTGAAQLERESPVNAFRRMLVDFSHATTWSDAGLALQDSQMSAAGGTAEKANDIALWTIYLHVTVTE